MQHMNWSEFFGAFGGFVALVIASFAGAWIKIQNIKLSQIQAQAEDAKKHAEDTASTVKESREERSQQFEKLTEEATKAYNHANNTNDKLARQNAEILRMRRELLDLQKALAAATGTVETPAAPPVKPSLP